MLGGLKSRGLVIGMRVGARGRYCGVSRLGVEDDEGAWEWKYPDGCKTERPGRVGVTLWLSGL